MTPTTSARGPESDDGRQDAPGATDAATEAREALDLDAIETRAKALATTGDFHTVTIDGRTYGHLEPEACVAILLGQYAATTLALVRELRDARAEVDALRAHDYLQVASMDGYAIDLAAAEAERDDLRARLAKVEALANDMDERGKPGADDSLIDTASRRQIREDAQRLRNAIGGDR